MCPKAETITRSQRFIITSLGRGVLPRSQERAVLTAAEETPTILGNDCATDVFEKLRYTEYTLGGFTSETTSLTMVGYHCGQTCERP